MIPLLFVMMFLIMLLAAIEIYGEDMDVRPTWLIVGEIAVNVSIYITFLALILVALIEFIF